MGASYKVLQGAFAGTISYSYTMENPKAFFQVLGGIIEQPHILEVADDAAFADGEGVFLASSATKYGVVSGTPTGNKITLKKFSVGEVITGAGGGTGTLLRIEGPTMYIKKTNTTAYIDGEIITGGTSAAEVTATAVISEVIVAGALETITIAKPTDADGISDTASSAADTTISDIIYHHYIFAWRDGPSYAIVWVYEDLDIGQSPSESPQRLLTGSVCESMSLDVVSNDIPKVKQSWQVATSVDEDVKDTEQTNAVTTLFEWTNIPDTTGFLINSVDYSGLFKTLNIEVKRKLGKIFGNSLNPKALRGATIESSLKVGIHRQDVVERNLVRNWGDSSGDPVAATFVFNRGTNGEDSFDVNYAAVRLPKISESVGEETILQDMAFSVEGSPTINAYDKIQYYGSGS